MPFWYHKRLIASGLGDFRTALRPLLWYHLWFLLVYLAVLAPTTGWLLNGFLSLTGHPLVSNYDLLSFGLTPIGALFFLVTGGLHLALFYFEQAGLLILAMNHLTAGKMTPIRILKVSLSRLPELVRLGLWQVLVYGVFLIPVGLGLYGVHQWMLGGLDINYHLAENTLEWRRAKRVAAGLLGVYGLGGGWLYLRWMFALAEVVFNDQQSRAALIRSWRLTRNHTGSLAVPIVGWWFTFITITLCGGWLVHGFTELLLGWAGLRLRWVLPLMIGMGSIALMVGLMSSVVWAAVHQFLVARLFIAREEGLHPKQAFEVQRTQRTAVLCWRWLRWVVPSCLCIALVSMLYQLHTLDLSINTQITAHRGSSRTAPENTLAAVHQAILDKADFVEIDVQTTRDGRVVVLHDADLKRVAGDPRRIGEFTLDELQKLDVGAWFSDSFRGERVPTLTEVIEEARGRVRWNVELKYNRPDPLLVRKTIAVLREANLADTCVITSLDQRAIDEVRRLAPEFKTGLILTTAMGRRLGVSTDFLSVNARQLQGSFLAAARKRGLAIHVWTVNDRDQMLRMLVWGVDNIITDEPAMLRDLINELESLSPPERLAVNLRTSILSVPRSR